MGYNSNKFLSIFLFLFAFNFSVAQDFTVVLDAGHGGEDPGKVASGFQEKDIALEVVLKTGRLLQEKGIKVIYTRKKDIFVDLYKRGEIANKAKADLFVSVHCNAHNTNASGAETFVLGLHANRQNFEVAKSENEVIYLENDYESRYTRYNINSPESVIGITIAQEEYLEQSVYLATLIQDYFTTNLGRKNRGVKQAGFIVLHQTVMPSILVELGFITNPDERLYLKSSRGQEEFAEALKESILNYKEYMVQNKIYFGSENKQQIKKKPPPVIKKKPPLSVKPPQKASQSSGFSEKGIFYRIQLLALSREISPIKSNFKGLDVDVEERGNLYRYLYGKSKTYYSAKKMKKRALQKGFKDAYIVAYKDGLRISVKKAIALQK